MRQFFFFFLVLTKGTVGSKVDALLLQVGDQLVVLQESWVSLDLVGSGHDTSGLDNGLDVLDGEVGNTNVLDLGLGQGHHGLPSVNQRHTVVQRNLILLLGVQGKQVAADVANQREGNGPVDQVEVEVVKLELGEGVVEGLLDVLGAVGVVPQLGGDEDVLALEAKVLQALVKTLCDLLLVLVDLGQVKVAVARLQGLVDAHRDLAGLGLPGTVPESAVDVANTQSATLVASRELKEKLLAQFREEARGRERKDLRDLLTGEELGLGSERHLCL